MRRPPFRVYPRRPGEALQRGKPLKAGLSERAELVAFDLVREK
jgi:hypothetical protein